jgi:hypothetical protein
MKSFMLSKTDWWILVQTRNLCLFSMCMHFSREFCTGNPLSFASKKGAV